MEEKRQYNINISLPSLMNICVDEMVNGEIAGRLYHCYDKQPISFCNVIELLMEAEEVFDRIRYPQASTRSRCFHDREEISQMPLPRPEKVADQREIIQYRGDLASVVLAVRFRQNSTWQGEFVRMETGERKRFFNTLDFLKLLDHELVSILK